MRKGLPIQMLRSKRALAAGAALAVAVGAGGAIAASKGPSRTGDGFLARVAGHLGISPERLQEATKAAAIDQVDADLEAGRITKAHADAFKARIRAGNVPLFGGPHRFGERHGFRGFHRGGHLSAAADYLGLTVPQLLQNLSGGKSLAAVAKARGKSVEGLKQAMLADAGKNLDRAAKHGLLTEAQAKEKLNALESRIDAIVAGTFRGRGERHEFRFRGGPPGDRSLLPPAA